MKISEMETNDIKIMLNTMNNQIRHSNFNNQNLLKHIYKDHIEACENELKKRGFANENS